MTFSSYAEYVADEEGVAAIRATLEVSGEEFAFGSCRFQVYADQVCVDLGVGEFGEIRLFTRGYRERKSLFLFEQYPFGPPFEYEPHFEVTGPPGVADHLAFTVSVVGEGYWFEFEFQPSRQYELGRHDMTLHITVDGRTCSLPFVAEVRRV